MATAASSVVVPVSEPGDEEADRQTFTKNLGMRCTTVSEIEEDSSGDLFEIGHSAAGAPLGREDPLDGSFFSYDIHRAGEVEEEDDCVYVAIGKDESASMDALRWALRNIPAAAAGTTTVYLVHVFPETHTIPSPLGNLPISSVSTEQVETYKSKERFKRREMLQKFVNACDASKVKVDTILIECDGFAKAILELLPVLNIRQMVFGAPRSSLRRLRSRKGNGIAEILQKAPDLSCEIRIICGGEEERLDQTVIESPTATPRGNDEGFKGMPHPEEENQCRDIFSCICFKPKTL